MLRYSTRLSRRTVTRPGSGFCRVDPERRELDPVFQEPPLLVGRPRLAGRRHDAGPHVLQDAPPEIAIMQSRLIGFNAIEVDPALLDPVAVAAVTMIFEDRLDLLAELLAGQVGRDRDSGARHQGRKDDNDRRPNGDSSHSTSQPVGFFQRRALEEQSGMHRIPSREDGGRTLQ